MTTIPDRAERVKVLRWFVAGVLRTERAFADLAAAEDTRAAGEGE